MPDPGQRPREAAGPQPAAPSRRPDALKQLQVSDIEEIRYLEASQATARFGTSSARPVIHVISRRAR